MSIEITTQLIHASYASVIRTIDENANIYDNPNQQGTYYPAWFIVHRSPVELQKGIGRWTLVYQIDIWYMLKSNQTRLYDQYSAIAEQLDDKLEYLPIFGTDACVHVLDRSWGLELDALKYSTTLRLYASRGPKPVIPYMEVIEDLRVFLKGLKQEFYTLSFTNTEHPDFIVELPDDIVVSANAFVKLPSVSGEHEEGGELWVPNGWDIGAFGSSVKMDEDKVANLLWEELQQFVVSFANTTYPQFDVDLPEQAVVVAGESITLPLVSGQFVEDGYVCTPSGWDIGDFGSEFTPTGNTIANLIFNVEKQYEEITLYGNVSPRIACQNNVTSGFTGNVNTANVLQLYTDNTYTTPWNGYDYGNDYEMGRYVDGAWYSRGGTIADLPSTTADPGNGETVSTLFILLDTGCLWFVCNNSNSSYGYNNQHAYFYGAITLRIYPKGQQWIPVFPYNPSYGEYDNLSTSRKGTFVRMGSPAAVFGTFPAIAESFGYKSGMIKIASIQAELQISQAVLYLNVVGNPALSNIVVRFENDICTGYVRSDKADLPTAPSYDGATYTIKDDNGNDIDYDDSFTYKFVLLLNSTGNAVGGTYSTGAMIKSSTGKLQVRIRSMSSKFNRVWYYRIPIS